MKILNNPLVSMLVAAIVVLTFFYFMNIGIMSIQGLPLNANLTPAQ